jgi:NHL repeat
MTSEISGGDYGAFFRARAQKKVLVAAAMTLAILAFSVAPALAEEGLGVTSRFGGPGSGPGELSLVVARGGAREPRFGSGLGVDDAGDVYVADTGNNRVEWFNSAGQYAGQFNGSGVPGGLTAPESIAIDNDSSSESYGDVYVVDNGDSVVDKFSATGKFLSQFSTDVGQIAAIAIDPSGDVWIVGLRAAPVQEFSGATKNTLLTSLGELAKPPRGGAADALAVDSEGNLYIDLGSYLYKFSKTGTYLGSVCEVEQCATHVAIDPVNNDLIAEPGVGRESEYTEPIGTSVAQYGPFGEPFEAPIISSKPNIFAEGAGIAVSPTSHRVYVTEAAGDQVDLVENGEKPEKPETLAATEVKDKSAILHGKFNAKELTTKLKYYFEYSTEGACTGGSKTPVQEGEGEVSEQATGLEPNAEYTFCFVAENTYGESEPGSPETVNTSAAPPEIVSESASSERLTKDELAATINPENEETTYYFEYSTEVNGEELVGATKTGETTLSVEFGQLLQASAPGVEVSFVETLYYRVVAENGQSRKEGKPVVGKVQSYTKLPLVADESLTDLTSISAKLEAKVNPVFQEGATYEFEYATGENAKKLLEEGKGTPVPNGAGGLPEESNEPDAVVVEVFSLRPGQTYYYRVVAENQASRNPGNINKGKPVRGKIEEFTPYAVPKAVTIAGAQSVTQTSATLSGTVDPEGAPTTYYFEYISEAGYRAALAKGIANPYEEGETTAPVSAGTGEVAEAVGPIPATGLLPGETYRYALVATNQFGARGTGAEYTFTTLSALPPVVSTGGASAISQNSATLSGTVGTNGLQTSYGFEIATEPNHYGPATGLGAIGGAATEEVHVALGELQPGTTYYYRITATNADGTVQGQPGSFTTPGFPTLLTAPSSTPLIAVPNIAFPKEEKTSTGATVKTLTTKEKLAKALKSCKKDKSKTRRETCEKQARKKYPVAKSKRKGAGKKK